MWLPIGSEMNVSDQQEESIYILPIDKCICKYWIKIYKYQQIHMQNKWRYGCMISKNNLQSSST